MLVELGGGTNPHPRADVVIDLHHPKASHPQDAANTPWQTGQYGAPLETGSVDEVFASHFMEHIHRGQPLINVMNEAWRVLKPGGTFTMILPLVGFTDEFGHGQLVRGWQPYADPTHVNLWWFPEALLYFCEGPFKPHANYGIHVWKQLGPFRNVPAGPVIDGPDSFWSVRDGWEGVARLVKP